MDGYSRLVAFLKVILPLTALGLLSTLFLLSRSVDPTATLPFEEAEVTERLRDGLVTSPHYAGMTKGGDQVTIIASTAKPGNQGEFAQARDVNALIEMTNGTDVTLDSLTGSFDPAGDFARFTGNVQIETTTGYTLNTEALNSRIRSLDLRSDGAVDGEGPFGTLEAGQMELTTDALTEDAYLRFKNGVRLIYDPKLVEDGP